VQAILESARTRAWVKVKATDKPDRPTEDQKINKPPVKPKQLVDASSPSGKS